MNGRYVPLKERSGNGARVLLAMSGGVDSAASAVLLRQAGYDVIGLTMKNYCYGDAEVPDRSCCSHEAIGDARSACDRIGISHMVADTEEVFGAEVYDNFLHEYKNGRTPNPCVRCNSIVRFSTLVDYADRLDVDYVASGHYARVFRADNDRLYLARSLHPEKDQSYFLSGLTNDDLQRVLFPLGDYEKSNVRAAARDAYLTVADKPESQEVCFIPSGTLRDFLTGKVPMAPGNIERSDGTVVGRHEGLAAFTVGQRRGLGVAAENPLYVVRLDTARNVLVIGDDADLWSRDLSCRVHWIDEERVTRDGISAQIRSRHFAEAVESVALQDGRADVRFAEPQRAIAPGQTVAFYDGDVVVGSGVIDSAGAA